MGGCLELRQVAPMMETFPSAVTCCWSSSHAPPVPAQDAYGAEINYFAQQLASGKPFDRAPLEEAVTAVELCLAEELSCRTGPCRFSRNKMN